MDPPAPAPAAGCKVQRDRLTVPGCAGVNKPRNPVLSFRSSFIEDNVLHIVFELATAGDLSRMITHFKKQRRLIPERTIWKYFVQLCRALAHLHDRRVMHRGEPSILAPTTT